MSNSAYDELWREAQIILEGLIQSDSMLQSAKPQKDRNKAHKLISELYIKYIVVCNKLEECYDQIIQPQKRIVIKKLLDGTIGRVLELKHQLVDIDLSEYNYYDNMIIENNLTPEEVEIRVPKYYRRDRLKDIFDKRMFMEETLRNIGALDEVIEPKKITEIEAIRLIQVHERARQGRLKFQFMKEIREMKEKSTLRPEQEEEKTKNDGSEAAVKIQKLWRGYTTRREIRKRRIEEMLLIGMLQPSQVITDNARKVDEIIIHRYKKQQNFQDQYEKMILESEERIRREKSKIIEENMRQDIRNWINSYYQQTGKIPDLPSVESGGSRMILSRQGTESSLSKSTGTSSKESKRSKKSRGKKDSEPEQSEDETELGFKSMPSNFLPILIQANQEYQDTWKGKDESNNPFQVPYADMIEGEKTRQVEDEVRIGVDEALRADIEALQAALDRDKGLKPKRGKKCQKRVRRSGKKNKKKKEKDLTPDRTTESLFEELLQQGIIKLNPEIPLSQFKGEKSFANYDLNVKDRKKDFMPALGDAKQLLVEYCIIPLGNEMIRELTPLVRSILIAGPRGSGKKMLVNAICTELGAVLFDLTPSNIAGKYPGKSGLIMLLHLISKVSKLLQPSVIFMNDAEKPYARKISKTDKTDPKRLKKDLPKLIKNITNEDRVIFIGATSCPWDCDQKLLFQTYDKFVYIPKPDYGTVSLLWRDLLYKYSGISRQFDISAMTKICDGFTVGAILEAINDVMTTKRMVQLRTQPLTYVELVNSLSSKDPIYLEEEESFLGWYFKTPTCRKKKRAIELEQQRLEEANEKKKKKGKK